jgi:hypothetical protein
MPKGQQRTNKEAKKPKKDSSAAPKPLSSGAPVAPPAPLVMERGKKKGL